MTYAPENPLIVQSDHTVLLEVQSERYGEARDALLGFAELIKRPEYIHTWRLTDLSLWNAAASGLGADQVCTTLTSLAKYPVPDVVLQKVQDAMGRYGALTLVRDGQWLLLEANDAAVLSALSRLKTIAPLLAEPPVDGRVRVGPQHRGELKQLLLHAGHPVRDLCGYDDGDTLDLSFRDTLDDGTPWSLRDYQVDAIDAFSQGDDSGSGVIVLPCGAGKTMVGVGSMVRLGMRTLILCSGHTAARQWRREVLARTHLREDQVGVYTGDNPQLYPVTLTTYQLLTWRRSANAAPEHFRVFYEANWGLVIYDEVHLLPAPIFRQSAYLQARRRLGLTATLVREDGREGDVFALIGPKRFDLPWKALEEQGWIATARCIEVRVPLSPEDRQRYLEASARTQSAIAARNARKIQALDEILKRHADAQVLILGTYVDQLEFAARRLGVDVITGKTPKAKREELYTAFRAGETRILALSKVGNFAIDLPSATVAIQISGTFGSRQEEAQRLGRILRPTPGTQQATFYTLVSPDTREQVFAERRQLFLAEQGYPYEVEHHA